MGTDWISASADPDLKYILYRLHNTEWLIPFKYSRTRRRIENNIGDSASATDWKI
jgi:hypothetical protein